MPGDRRSVRPWVAAGLTAGAGLILLGLLMPANGLPAQTAIHPAKPELLVAGERLFKYGLVSHGLLLVSVVIIGWRLALAHSPRSLGATARAKREPNAGALLNFKGASEPGRPGLAAPAWFAAILGTAVAARLIGLNSGLWYDEVVTLTEFVRLPFGELVRNYADQNQHPLFSLLAHGAVVIFGESPWALRLPAVVFGLATLFVLYGFSRRLVPWPEPVLAAALLAVSYHHVWFSQNGRGYTMLAFWTLLGSWLFMENAGRPRLPLTLGYAAVMALALYTHLTAGFVVAAHGLIYLFLLTRKGLARHRLAATDWLPMAGFALTATLALQLYAPVLPQVLASFQAQAVGSRVQAWTNPLWGIAQLLGGLQMGFVGALGGLLAAAIVGAGTIDFARRNGLAVALFVLPCVLGAGVMLLLNRHLYPRFFFSVFPFAIIIVARGAMIVGRGAAALLSVFRGERAAGNVGMAFGVVLILLSAASLIRGYRYPKQDYARAVDFIDASRGPSEPVVVVGMASIPLMRWYAPGVECAESAEELQAIRNREPRRPTWLIYTFRDHMASYHPDILAVIDRDFVCEGSFPGTVGGGSVLVCRSESRDGRSELPDHGPIRLGRE